MVSYYFDYAFVCVMIRLSVSFYRRAEFLARLADSGLDLCDLHSCYCVCVRVYCVPPRLTKMTPVEEAGSLANFRHSLWVLWGVCHHGGVDLLALFLGMTRANSNPLFLFQSGQQGFC